MTVFGDLTQAMSAIVLTTFGEPVVFHLEGQPQALAGRGVFTAMHQEVDASTGVSVSCVQPVLEVRLADLPATPTEPFVQHLVLVDAATLEVTPLAEEWDHWAVPLGWSPDGTTLYVSSYKPQTLAIDAPSGQPMWVQQGQGGVGGVASSGSGRLAVTDAQDVVWALDATSGAPLWKQPSYPRRALTAPAILGNQVVVGDFDGYLHWFSLDDGHMSARVRASRKPVRAKPVVADGILLVQDTDGNLIAYRAGE